METNKTIQAESELSKKAAALIEAAYDYWEEYTKSGLGPVAVVWLEADNGHFVLFTRGEYKEAIMAAANRECRGEPAMFENPFSG